jgi:hypothetical protein
MSLLLDYYFSNEMVILFMICCNVLCWVHGVVQCTVLCPSLFRDSNSCSQQTDFFSVAAFGGLWIPQITMLTALTWGFFSQLPLLTKRHVGLHVKCPLLLSDLNQNWNVQTNFSKTSQYQLL